MGRNSGNKENFISIILIGFVLVEMGIAFIGLWKFKGFIAEGELYNATLLGYVGELLAAPLARFVHLSMIPIIIALLAGVIEKFPLVRKKMKNKTISPLNQLLATFVAYAIQLAPAIIGMKTTKGNLISPTWLSDLIMVPWGYGALSFIFIASMIVGLLYIVFGFFLAEQKKGEVDYKPLFYSVGIIYLSVISFTGAGKMVGFLREYGVSSIDEFVQRYDFIYLFYDGPFTRYSRLILIPAIAGSIVFIYTVVMKDKSKIKIAPISRLSLFAFIVMLLQIVPAVVNGTNPTVIVDEIVSEGGYILLALAYLAGIFIGLYRSLTGNVLHQK